MLLLRYTILVVLLLCCLQSSVYTAEAKDAVITAADSVPNEAAAELLAVDAGVAHEHESQRAARQFRTFGFRRPFFGGGYRRPFFGGYRRPFYGGGGFYRPGFYGGYRPYFGGYSGFYRPRPFFGFYG